MFDLTQHSILFSTCSLISLFSAFKSFHKVTSNSDSVNLNWIDWIQQNFISSDSLFLFKQENECEKFQLFSLHLQFEDCFVHNRRVTQIQNHSFYCSYLTVFNRSVLITTGDSYVIRTENSEIPSKWADNEEIQIFREYLRIPTVHPDVNYGIIFITENY